MNVTDVGHLTSDEDSGEDKLEKGARLEGKTPEEIARFYEKAFFDDAARLNILTPHIVCRATDHVADMIELVRRIEANGFAYRTSVGLIFDTAKYPEYARLSPAQPGRAAGRRAHHGGPGAPQPVRLRAVDNEPAEAPDAVGLALGPRLSRLAPRVLGDVHQVPRGALRHPHRRHRPHPGPPHQRARPELRRHRQGSRRALDAQRLPRHRRRPDGQVRGQSRHHFPTGEAGRRAGRLPLPLPHRAVPDAAELHRRVAPERTQLLARAGRASAATRRTGRSRTRSGPSRCEPSSGKRSPTT